MNPEHNSPELWDRVWGQPTSPADDSFQVATEAMSVRWRRLQAVLRDCLGNPRGLRVIEIGAGAGTHSALIASLGCEVTVLDYSKAALRRAEARLSRHDISATYVLADALHLPSSLLGAFDVSMSFGVTEHFRGDQRVAINRAHLDVLRQGGLTFVSVPNRFCLPYRLFKFVTERAGTWDVGEEYPYSRRELAAMFSAFGAVDIGFFGESVWASWRFLNPLRHSGRLRRALGVKQRTTRTEPRRESGTPLDAWLAYALVIHARRQ